MTVRCVVCGEDIADGGAVAGDERSPSHPVCESMPDTLKAKISICPVCGHIAGRHLEVTAFDLAAGTVRARPSACTCGCDYYLLPGGGSDPMPTRRPATPRPASAQQRPGPACP